MPIIINGGSRRAGGWWAKHLENQATNERVEVVQIVGLNATSMPEAFNEMYAVSRGTRCDNYFYQANINPRADETLDARAMARSQRQIALEKNLGLAGPPDFRGRHERMAAPIGTRGVANRYRADAGDPGLLTAAIHDAPRGNWKSPSTLNAALGFLALGTRDGPRPERGPKNGSAPVRSARASVPRKPRPSSQNSGTRLIPGGH